MGSRSMPPTVVEVRSPMVCTELTMYTMAREAMAEGTNLISKGIMGGRDTQEALLTLDRSTMPTKKAAM